MVISLRRSLVVVGIALGIFVAAVWAGGQLSQAAASAAEAASDSDWAGLGPAVLGFALTALLSLTLAIVTVAIGLSGRDQRRNFTLLFAVVLLAYAFIAWRYWGPALVAFPLVWAVPAASVGLIRWRWPAIGLGVVALAVLGGGVLGAFTVSQEQAALNDAYSGPTYVPSTSPESPLPGYVLRKIDGLNAYRTDELSLSYIRPGASSEDDEYYDIDFTQTEDVDLCIGEGPDCGKIGTALGSPVTSDGFHTYLVAVDGGVITLKSYFSAEEALVVLNDLRTGTVDEFMNLKLDPEHAIR